MSAEEDIAADLAAEPAPQAQASAEPGAAVVELPDQKTTTYSSSRVKPGPGEAAAQQELGAALDEEKKAAEAVGAATADEQEGKALAAEDRAAQGRINQTDFELEQQRQEQAMQQAQAVADKADQDFKSYKIHDYFDDKSAGDRFVTALFAAVGAWGGGANPGLDYLNRRIEMNFQRQKIELMSQEKFADAKHQGVKDLQSWFQQQNYMLKLKQAAATSAAADEAEAAMIRRGIPKAQAQADVTVAGLRTKAAQIRLQAQQRYATTVHASTSKVEGKAVLDRSAGKQEEKEDARTIYRDNQKFARVNSPRVAKPASDRLVQYEDAIKSLEAIAEKVKANPITGRIPKGDEVDRAILAIAATTTANPSDATTKHEAATLKNAVGLIDPDAVQRTLEHTKERYRKFLGNLEPIKGLPAPQSIAEGGGKRKSLDDLAAEHLR